MLQRWRFLEVIDLPSDWDSFLLSSRTWLRYSFNLQRWCLYRKLTTSSSAPLVSKSDLFLQRQIRILNITYFLTKSLGLMPILRAACYSLGESISHLSFSSYFKVFTSHIRSLLIFFGLCSSSSKSAIYALIYFNTTRYEFL